MKPLYPLLLSVVLMPGASYAQRNDTQSIGFSMGGPVYPLSKGSHISTMGIFGISYSRNIKPTWQLCGKIESTNWVYEIGDDWKYPITLGSDEDSPLTFHQFAIEPQIGARYCLTYKKFSFMPGVFIGLEIPFRSRKTLYVKDYGSSEIYRNISRFENNRVAPTISAYLRFSLRCSRCISLALEAGYHQSFARREFSSTVTPLFRPEDVVSTITATKTDILRIPVALSLDIHL